MISNERGNIVEVNGGSKKQKEFTAKIAHWCIRQLMPRMKTLDICIDLKKEFNLCYKRWKTKHMKNKKYY